jgi:hypothetical protein
MALSAVALPLAVFGGSVAHAQSIMRTPSLHIDSRVTTINPTVAPRVNPTVGTRINPTITSRTSVGVTTIARMPPIRSGGGSTSIMRTPDSHIGILHIGAEKLPYARYSHSLYPVCEYANRGPDGECFDRPIVSNGGGNGAVNGGVYNCDPGTWPAGTMFADAGRYVSLRTDYRAIFWEILRDHMGADPAKVNTVFPGYTGLGLTELGLIT